jgi:hypothetical protein
VAQPEIVAEREVPIGSDGTVQVEIDTSLAKAVHSDQDHSYSIQAEVTDQSRRTIVGAGNVLVARKPFEVFAWVDRGYYRVGDTIGANFAARRIDGKPVEGAGKLRLLKITYGEAPAVGGVSDADNGDKSKKSSASERPPTKVARKPIETEVKSWNLATNAQGLADIQLKASEQGQYRLSYRVTDKAGHEIEGGYLFTIVGEGFDGSDFRFNELELIPNKQTYAPDDKVELQLNTNRVSSTVLLFVRPANGAYLAPKTLQVAGKSTVEEIPVTIKDMPNFFVEAVTISNGKVHTEVREIHVPPAKRVLNLELVPSATEYRPRERAKVQLKLTDENGKPFVGSTVLSIFDISLEYISGGSNVPEIKEFFWKWRREHRPYLETNLERWFTNLIPPGQKMMESLGVFGSTVAEDKLSELDLVQSTVNISGRRPQQVMLGAPMSRAGGVMEQSAAEMAPAQAAFAKAPADGAGGAAGAGVPLIEPTVRSEFADTALWVASLETNKEGLAEVEFDMPDNLTAWRIRAWAMGHGTRVGDASTDVVTRKNLIVRMQAPRFFVETDEVVLSANVHNYLATAKQVNVKLELDGSTIELPMAAESTIEVPAGGEKRIDWRVKVKREGEAVIRMVARPASRIALPALSRPAPDTASPKADHHTIELTHPYMRSRRSSCQPLPRTGPSTTQ